MSRDPDSVTPGIGVVADEHRGLPGIAIAGIAAPAAPLRRNDDDLLTPERDLGRPVTARLLDDEERLAKHSRHGDPQHDGDRELNTYRTQHRAPFIRRVPRQTHVDLASTTSSDAAIVRPVTASCRRFHTSQALVPRTITSIVSKPTQAVRHAPTDVPSGSVAVR